MSRVSIIIPVFNSARYLPRTMPGWLRQDFERDYEVIVVDNGSTDASASLLAEIAGDPRVRLLSESRRGAYAARNTGVASASGELLVFTDPDCIAPPHWLRELTAPFADPSVHAVQGPASPPPGNENLRLLGLYETARERRVYGMEDATAYYAHTNNFATRRSAFDRFGPFVERMRGSDVIYVRTLVDHEGTKAAVHAPRAELTHLEIDSVATYLRKVQTYGRSRRQYSRIRKARPLTSGERWRAYRDAVRDEQLGLMESARLLSLLGLGLFCWYRGHLTARAEAAPGGSQPSTSRRKPAPAATSPEGGLP